MKMILAVSGGVDSMVMLDMFLRKFPRSEIAVATFDHGARESSKTDADFVEKSANFSEVQPALRSRFYRGEAPKSDKISESEARRLRYDFLRRVAFREKGEIFVAQHVDDLVESVAINLVRGTGIRGLAPMTRIGVRRPFLDGFFNPREYGFSMFDKRAILKYAAEHEVKFRQDPTNTTDDYLRNRIREKLREMPEGEKMKIFELWKKQKQIVREIDEIVENVLPEDLKFSREEFFSLERDVAIEIIRGGLERAGVSATRPQMDEFLAAILNYQPGKWFNLPENRLVKINKRDFKL